MVYTRQIKTNRVSITGTPVRLTIEKTNGGHLQAQMGENAVLSFEERHHKYLVLEGDAEGIQQREKQRFLRSRRVAQRGIGRVVPVSVASFGLALPLLVLLAFALDSLFQEHPPPNNQGRFAVASIQSERTYGLIKRSPNAPHAGKISPTRLVSKNTKRIK